MARTQALDYDDQRSAILDCAGDVFAASSYAASTMAQIATASGASKARLYHYYESKEAILFDLLDRHTQRLLGIAQAVRERGRRENLPPTDELRALIGNFLDAYQNSRTRHIALLNDVKFLAPEQQRQIRARERAVVDAFLTALSRAFPKRVKPRNARALTMMLMGAMNWTFTWLKPDGALSYADYADEVTRALFDGLAA